MISQKQIQRRLITTPAAFATEPFQQGELALSESNGELYRMAAGSVPITLGKGMLIVEGMTNFTSTPASPTAAGQRWVDTSVPGLIQEWFGSAWASYAVAQGTQIYDRFTAKHYYFTGSAWAPLLITDGFHQRGHAVVSDVTAQTVFFQDEFMRMRINGDFEVQAISAALDLGVFHLSVKSSGTALPPATNEPWRGGSGTVPVAPTWTTISLTNIDLSYRSVLWMSIAIKDVAVRYHIEAVGLTTLQLLVTVDRFDYRMMTANELITF